MFDRIALRYDLLNRIISLRCDAMWRRKVVAAALRGGERSILDVGTGTGDLAFAAAAVVGRDGRVVGVDFAPRMLECARRKKRRTTNGKVVDFVLADALAPPFKTGKFDVVMTAFVLRNVGDLGLFFANAYRLLGPGGRFVTVDMFPPGGKIFSRLYALYFYRLVPWVGGFLAGDRGAYRYLSESVRRFISPRSVAEMLEETGFATVQWRPYLRGAVCLHVAIKSDGDRRT
jgi:demethylmenaquinone methyltransferase/2-methoxy-6-polyprenyl-1,4-benzoquinol methylase